jgi:hypothetical protein
MRACLNSHVARARDEQSAAPKRSRQLLNSHDQRIASVYTHPLHLKSDTEPAD